MISDAVVSSRGIKKAHETIISEVELSASWGDGRIVAV